MTRAFWESSFCSIAAVGGGSCAERATERRAREVISGVNRTIVRGSVSEGTFFYAHFESTTSGPLRLTIPQHPELVMLPRAGRPVIFSVAPESADSSATTDTHT